MIYIALLRAINVGGYRKIKMADLRAMFSSMGFKNVTTYIQSGNVVFNSDLSQPEQLSQSIEEQIQKSFGHEVVVIIRTLQQLEELLDKNPFKGQNNDPYKLYVTFFQTKPSSKIQNLIRNLSNSIENYQFYNGELFSLIDKKTDQKVLFSNNYIEKKASISGTTRNWKSVGKILHLAKKL